MTDSKGREVEAADTTFDQRQQKQVGKQRKGSAGGQTAQRFRGSEARGNMRHNGCAFGVYREAGRGRGYVCGAREWVVGCGLSGERECACV